MFRKNYYSFMTNLTILCGFGVFTLLHMPHFDRLPVFSSLCHVLEELFPSSWNKTRQLLAYVSNYLFFFYHSDTLSEEQWVYWHGFSDTSHVWILTLYCSPPQDRELRPEEMDGMWGCIYQNNKYKRDIFKIHPVFLIFGFSHRATWGI